VSLLEAAATAALMLAKHPPVPPGLTHPVPASVRLDVPKNNAMNASMARSHDVDL
jgi:hypothetical protein